MRFITSMLSNIGGREKNEDFVDYFYNDNSCGAWILGDGLGGHLDGEKASRIAVETALKEFKENNNLTSNNIENVFLKANSAVIDGQGNQRLKNGMRSTLVGLFTDSKEVLWAHVGDSRLYVFRKNNPLIQTKDHSVSQMAVASGEISLDEIRFHEDRNKLLRVLGNEPELRVEVIKNPVKINAQDVFLICSDGFWELVYELEMEIDLSKSKTPDEWLRYMSERVYQRAKNSFDNFSAIAVFVEL